MPRIPHKHKRWHLIAITCGLLAFIVPSIRAQQFHNLNFEQSCDTSPTGICNWELSWGPKANVGHDGASLLLSGDKKNAVAFVEQSGNIPPLTDVMVLTLSGSISTNAVEGKGAGLNVNLYDSEGKLLAFKDMGGVYSMDWVRGTNNAKTYSISIVCPTGTARVTIGAILYGKGTARFGNYSVNTSSIAGRVPSKLAVRYISAAAAIIKKHSLVRDSFDIAAMKKTALQIAGNAKSYEDCYLAVSYLLESLESDGDYHSFFMKAREVASWKTGGSQVSAVEYPTYKIIDGVGYINVPSFHGGNQTTMLAYADALQNALRELEHSAVKGWLIDLRLNTGGNMEPMIAGLGPLFSSGKLGSLVDVNKRSEAWYYKNGRYFGDDYKGWRVTRPYTLARQLPIAVLTSSSVGSSGEIVVISFIGNAKTRSFGQSTMGLTTGNGSYDLIDGAKMFLASTVMADRTGKMYRGGIKPDVEFDKMIVDGKDVVLADSIKWILSSSD